MWQKSFKEELQKLGGVPKLKTFFAAGKEVEPLVTKTKKGVEAAAATAYQAGTEAASKASEIGIATTETGAGVKAFVAAAGDPELAFGKYLARPNVQLAQRRLADRTLSRKQRYEYRTEKGGWTKVRDALGF
jgi:hypothetical protein